MPSTRQCSRIFLKAFQINSHLDATLGKAHLTAALAFATLWAWHPMRVEPVSWSTAITYHTCTAFFLMTLVALLEYIYTPARRTKWELLSLFHSLRLLLRARLHLGCDTVLFNPCFTLKTTSSQYQEITSAIIQPLPPNNYIRAHCPASSVFNNLGPYFPIIHLLCPD